MKIKKLENDFFFPKTLELWLYIKIEFSIILKKMQL
jgi:hypothetical protein